MTAEVDVVTRYFGALAVCQTAGTKEVISVFDGNFRTNSRQAASWAPERYSMDDKCDTRGRQALLFFKAHSLGILNGARPDWEHTGSWTSKQPRGSSVIDYVVVSRGVVGMVRHFAVGPLPNESSHHAALSLEINLPATTGSAANTRDFVPLPPIAPLAPALPGQHILDELLERTMAASLTS
ncbi:hypothetical protein AURDEDRAFT_164457 [Auricularia subglabra TFB-10046 SS5]|nr:hypothetical protein AURDEDRAFT_164457 [Auricularia subglabra TFB-10046 SS5]